MKRMIAGLIVLVMAALMLTGAAADTHGVCFGLSWGSSSDLAKIMLGKNGIEMGNKFKMVMRYDDIDYKGHKATVLLYFDMDKLNQIQLLVVDMETEKPERVALDFAEDFLQEYGKLVRGSMDDAAEGNAAVREDGDSLLWKTEDTGIWLEEKAPGIVDIRFSKLK